MEAKWFRGMTVCAELNRQGLLSDQEFKLERAYNLLNVARWLCFLYKCVIIPVVLLMRVSFRFTRIVHIIARKIWIDEAVRQMRWSQRVKRGLKNLISKGD